MINYLLYVDPGSGSYLLQAIIAAVFGAGFWIKMSWHRIKTFFGGKKVEVEDKENDKTAS